MVIVSLGYNRNVVLQCSKDDVQSSDFDLLIDCRILKAFLHTRDSTYGDCRYKNPDSSYIFRGLWLHVRKRCRVADAFWHWEVWTPATIDTSCCAIPNALLPASMEVTGAGGTPEGTALDVPCHHAYNLLSTFASTQFSRVTC